MKMKSKKERGWLSDKIDFKSETVTRDKKVII